MKKYIYIVESKKNGKKYIGVSDTVKNLGENTILDLKYKKEGKRNYFKKIIYEMNDFRLLDELLILLSKDNNAQILELKEKGWMNKGKNSGGNNGTARKVICLNNNKIFNSGVEAGIYAGVSKSSINKACRPEHPTKIAGKDPESGEPLKWMYYEEFESVQNGLKYEPEPSKTVRKNLGFVPVVCINTNEKFNSIKEASIAYKVRASAICDNCNFNLEYAGYHPETGEKLKWRYYSEDEK